ncbi:MAG TPA: DUF362 domain-containing protein [Bryobacteraceae bacterium]|nr:DUF362 domain-containing protein [Bryobacteraceae bacterium]
MNVISRRRLPLAAAGALGSCGGAKQEQPAAFAGRSVVSVLKASSYDADLTRTILLGLAQAGLPDVRGKRVLLKPNLVEFDRATAINTHPRVVLAAYEALRFLGASVSIGEGPGHRRDTFGLTEEAGYWQQFRALDDYFVDLNRDDVRSVGPFLGRPEFYFSETLLAADLIVSLPKMKTHHWAGATLSMKNFFGAVPGAVYGWPKNLLHYHGIANSIVALNRRFRNTFAIVDGIVGMEGNGPIQGQPRPMGALVFGRDLIAVDATCCRLMGIEPSRVEYLQLAADLGAIPELQIDQRGENPAALRKNFDLLPQFAGLRLG